MNLLENYLKIVAKNNYSGLSKNSNCIFTNSELELAEEYASNGSLFSIKKFGPHLKCESRVSEVSLFPEMYNAAAKASTVDNLLGLPQFTGLAATSIGNVL